MQLKLFLDSYCFYRYPLNIEGTLHDSCGYVSFVTAGGFNGLFMVKTETKLISEMSPGLASFYWETDYIYWVERKVFTFSKRWRKQTKKFFYKTGIEKLVTRWEMVIASNGNYIID
jgi:hypothetical protein